MSDTLLALDRHKLQTQFKDAEAALAHLATLPCETPEQRATFEQVMNMAHSKSKELVAERITLTNPLKTQVAEIEEPFRPVIKTMDALKELARAKVSQYDTSVALAAEASRNLAIAAAQEGRTEDCVLALAAVPEEVPSAFEWHAFVVNANLIEREFLEVSSTLINSYCKANRDSVTLSRPGLRFEKRAVVRAKGK